MKTGVKFFKGAFTYEIFDKTWVRPFPNTITLDIIVPPRNLQWKASRLRWTHKTTVKSSLHGGHVTRQPSDSKWKQIKIFLLDLIIRKDHLTTKGLRLIRSLNNDLLVITRRSLRSIDGTGKLVNYFFSILYTFLKASTQEPN